MLSTVLFLLATKKKRLIVFGAIRRFLVIFVKNTVGVSKKIMRLQIDPLLLQWVDLNPTLYL
jgi:hypothetical protein